MDVNIILSIIGALISLVAVLIIYNARRIVIEIFGIGDQNSGAITLKIIGAILFCIGMVIMLFNLR